MTRKALIALAGAVMIAVVACATESELSATTTPTTTSATSAPASPTQQAPASGEDRVCADLGGTVATDQLCHAESATSTYDLDIRFPVGYADPQPLADFLTQTRDEWIDATEEQPRDTPYLLAIVGTEYRAGAPDSRTQSMVLAMNSDFGAHPVSSFKAFNYDVSKDVPITLDTLFKPGVDPVDVVWPIVRRELQNRGMPVEQPFDSPTSEAFENFALADDAVIFFIGQGSVLPQVAGPQEVAVPRSELEAVLA